MRSFRTYSLCLAFFPHQHHVSTLWESPTPWEYQSLCEGATFYYPSAMSDDSGFSSLGLLWLVLWWTFLSIFVVSMDTPISAGTVPRSSRWVMDGHMLSLLRCCQTHVQSICSMLPFHQPYLSIPVALSANIRWHLLSWSVFISATLVCDCIDFTGISLLTKNTENFQKSLTMERSSFMRCLLKSSPTYLRCCCLLFSKCQLFVGGKNSENMFSNCVAFIDSSFPPPNI